MRRIRPGRLIFVLLALLCIFAISLPVTAEDAIRQVVVGVYENEPKVFTASDGKPSGIFIDILQSIAEAEGWDLRYRRDTWAEGLNHLKRGEIDLMPDVAYSAARDALYDFHEVPVLSDWFQVYARRGSGIQSIVDLDGKRVAVLERSVQQAAFESLVAGFDLEITLLSLPDYAAMFELVASGEADTAIVNRFYGQDQVRKYDIEDTAVIFNPTRLFFAAPKGRNEDLLRAIDTHLAGFKKDLGSVYYRTLQRWTSEKPAFVLPAWVKIAGLPAAAVLVISLLGSIILKRRIQKRTAELHAANQDMQRMIREAEHEIAARGEVEKALRASEARLIAAQRIGRMGDFTWDVETGEVTWSDALFDLLKYEKGVAFDYNGINERIHHPDDLERVTRWLNDCVASGRDELIPNEYRVICRDGEVKYVRAQGIIEREEGKAVRVFATIQDITRQKLAENDLRLLQSRLEGEVAERTLELRQKVERLDKNQKAMLYMVEDLNDITSELKEERQKLEMVNSELEAFSYSVSHDLRAPLRAIDGFSRIIEEEYAGSLDAEGLRLLTIVRDNTQRMDILITDLLEFSRAGRIEISLSKVDMRGTAVAMYHEIASPDIVESFRFDVAELPSAHGDPRLMRRVWSNLISNAIKYTIPKETRWIQINGWIEDNLIIYSIRDSGVGFNPAYGAKLFTIFQRLHGAEEFQGTGVGLSIVQRIITRHGGTVWAESEEGKGAVFYFSLPVREG